VENAEVKIVPGTSVMVALVTVVLVGVVLVTVVLTGSGLPGAHAKDAAARVPRDYLDSFAPLPSRFESASSQITEAKLKLGHMLFFEPRLSRNRCP